MPLSEEVFAPHAHPIVDLGQRFGSSNQLEQLHVTHGVEKVRNDEVLAEVLAASCEHVLQRQAGGVARNDGAGLNDRFDPSKQVLLDRDDLRDGFDNDVALGEFAEVVVEVADAHEGGARAVEEGCRARLKRLVETSLGKAVARYRLQALRVGEIFWYDVEQQHAHSGVGQMRCDRGSHHTSPQYSCISERLHHPRSLAGKEYRPVVPRASMQRGASNVARNGREGNGDFREVFARESSIDGSVGL